MSDISLTENKLCFLKEKRTKEDGLNSNKHKLELVKECISSKCFTGEFNGKEILYV